MRITILDVVLGACTIFLTLYFFRVDNLSITPELWAFSALLGEEVREIVGQADNLVGRAEVKLPLFGIKFCLSAITTISTCERTSDSLRRNLFVGLVSTTVSA